MGHTSKKYSKAEAVFWENDHTASQIVQSEKTGKMRPLENQCKEIPDIIKYIWDDEEIPEHWLGALLKIPPKPGDK